MNLIRNIFLILFFFLTFSVKLNAQDPVIDSLKIALKNAQHDTARCNILSELSEAESDEKIWPVYNEQLLRLSEKCLAATPSPTITLKYFYLKHLAGAINNIGYLARRQGDIPKALAYYNRSLKIEEEIKNKDGIANSLSNIGYIYDKQGDIAKALEYYYKSLKIQEDIKNKWGIANSLNNIGYIYNNQGDILKALDYYHKSLKMREEIEDKNGIAESLNNIGFIYDNQGDIPKALEYYYKSLKIREEIKDKQGIANSLNNIGLIYYHQGDIRKALVYFNKSLKIYEDIKNKSGIAKSLNNIGGIYNTQGDIPKALEYYHKSLKMKEEIKDKNGIAYTLNNIADAMLQKDSPYSSREGEAFDFASRSLQIAKELGYPDNIRRAATVLKKIFKKQNRFKEAFEMYDLEIQMRDSINNQETKKASVKKQFQYQYEKKAAADSVKNAEQQKVKNAQLTAQQAQLKQEKTQRLALYGGLGLMLLFAVFIFNRFKVTQHQKNIITDQKIKVDEAYEELNQQNEEIAAQRDEIETQKHKVEEHQKEIIDSITYAKRLQEAILPSRKFVTEYLPENFILYKPKDLVAGDFYWAESVGNSFLIAAADSTGHGVPGAIVSVVCSNALNRSLKEFGLTEPGQLLDKTRELVLETFSKSSNEVKDGMDISLLSIEKNENNIKVKWAGANNPLWYLLPNAEGLSEIKANKQPIGKTENPTPFTTHEIKYISGTTFYLFTDGYADQFGGDKGKKFKYKQLEELLMANARLALNEQSETLISKFESWKGNMEQVDDVCIIGVRI